VPPRNRLNVFALLLPTEAQHHRTELARVGAVRDFRMVNPEYLFDLYVAGWGLGHMSVVLAAGLVGSVGEHAELAASFAEQLAGCAARAGNSGIAMLGAWAIARLGTPGVDIMKQQFASSDPALVWEAALVLVAIALRERDAERDVRRHFKSVRKDHGELRWRLARRALRTLDQPAVSRNAFVARGRRIYAATTPGVELDAKTSIAVAVREEHTLGDAARDEDLDHAFECAAAIARLDAEELYLPRAVMKVVMPAWSPRASETMVRRRVARPEC
jgi:hypothetical protein